jgi:PKD repeat protein
MRTCLLITLATILAGCGGDGGSPPAPPASTPTVVVVHAGDAQTVASGEAAPIAPAVQVRDAQGRGVAGVTVTFAVAAGGGTIEGSTPSTDVDGVARIARWVLGTTGVQRLTAQTASLPSVTFSANILPGSEAVVSTVAASGGVVQITSDGHPFKGLRLEIPPGAFSGAETWTLRLASTAPAPALPSGFRIGGPALAISTTAMRAASLMTLIVPITRSSTAHTALALRDPLRRVWEVLPTIARTDSTITVLTAHLRRDLLVGRSAAASARVAGGPALAMLRADSAAELWPVEAVLPVPVVPPIYGADGAFDWPVRDQGSPLFPNFGLETSVLRFKLATSDSARTMSSVFRGLDTPGFYADGGPPAALAKAAEFRLGGYANLESFRFRLRASNTKAQADELVQRNLSTQLAITGQFVPLATYSSSAAAPFSDIYGANGVFGLAVGSPENTIIMSGAATPSKLNFVRTSAGFGELSASSGAHLPPTRVDAMLPVSSFVYPYERVDALANSVFRLGGTSGEERRRINFSLTEGAGVPQPQLEAEAVPGGGWVPVINNTFTLRSRDTRVRVRRAAGGGGGSDHGLHFADFTTRAELARSVGDTIAIGTVSAFRALPEGRSMSLVVSPTQRTLSLNLAQVTALDVELQRADFAIRPDTSRISADSLRVSMEAPVALPPAGGYRMRWQWGDGSVAETVNTATATHTYARPGNYTVVATLQTADTRATLAVDTAYVAERGAVASWIVTSFTDADGLFDDGPPGSGNVLIDVLARMLAAPRAGLITVDSGGAPVTRTLRLRVKPDAMWEAPGCCAAPLPNELRHSLGVDPPVTYAVGPFFAGWNRDFWTQSTTNLGAGTFTAQQLLNLADFNVENGGVQRGPAGAIRFTATRSGTAMTGTISIWLWPVNEDPPQYVDPPEEYRFPFTAVRVR